MRHNEPRCSPPPRRASVPAVAFASPTTVPTTPVGDEEEQAVAGRLEIRVVDSTGGATVVQTSADKEPLTSMSNFSQFIPFTLPYSNKNFRIFPYVGKYSTSIHTKFQFNISFRV